MKESEIIFSLTPNEISNLLQKSHTTKKPSAFLYVKIIKCFFIKFSNFLYRGTVISSPWPATIILKFNSLDNMITSPLPITPGLTKTASYFLIFKFFKIKYQI